MLNVAYKRCSNIASIAFTEKALIRNQYHFLFPSGSIRSMGEQMPVSGDMFTQYRQGEHYNTKFGRKGFTNQLFAELVFVGLKVHM